MRTDRGAPSARVRSIAFAAVFAALIYVSIIVFHVPNGIGGVVHFGDAVIFVCAVLLPKPYALIAAAVGPGLFNLTHGLGQWFVFTICIKPLMAACFTHGGPRVLVPRNIAAPFAAGVVGVVLYFFAYAILYGFGGAMAALPANGIQAVGSVALFFVLAVAIDAKRSLIFPIFGK